MKQFVLTLAAALVGGFLALLAYDRFIVQPRERAEATNAAARTGSTQATVAPDLSRARAEAKEITDDVEASVRRSVDNARHAMDNQATEMERADLVTDAVRRAAMFRVALTEFYQTNGRWPQDAEEAGLPAAEDARGGAVRTIVLGSHGVVTISLDDRFGDDGRLLLRPRVNAAGMVDWSCELKGDAALKRALPRCKG